MYKHPAQGCGTSALQVPDLPVRRVLLPARTAAAALRFRSHRHCCMQQARWAAGTNSKHSKSTQRGETNAVPRMGEGASSKGLGGHRCGVGLLLPPGKLCRVPKQGCSPGSAAAQRPPATPQLWALGQKGGDEQLRETQEKLKSPLLHMAVIYSGRGGVAGRNKAKGTSLGLSCKNVPGHKHQRRPASDGRVKSWIRKIRIYIRCPPGWLVKAFMAMY